MIDFAALSLLKKSEKVYLRGEWENKVVTPAVKDAAGNVTKPEETTREFTGLVLDVRALTAEETRLVQNGFDRPRVRERKNSNAGSKAEYIADFDHPDYVREARLHTDNVNAAWAAVACGHKEGGKLFGEMKDDGERKTWLKAASERFRAELFDAEVQAILLASRSLGNVAAGVEEALKN